MDEDGVGMSPDQERIRDSPVVSPDHYLRRKLALSPVGIILRTVAVAMRLGDTALHKGALHWFRGCCVEVGGVSFHRRQCVLCCLQGVSLHVVDAGGITSCI